MPGQDLNSAILDSQLRNTCTSSTETLEAGSGGNPVTVLMKTPTWAARRRPGATQPTGGGAGVAPRVLAAQPGRGRGPRNSTHTQDRSRRSCRRWSPPRLLRLCTRRLPPRPWRRCRPRPSPARRSPRAWPHTEAAAPAARPDRSASSPTRTWSSAPHGGCSGNAPPGVGAITVGTSTQAGAGSRLLGSTRRRRGRGRPGLMCAKQSAAWKRVTCLRPAGMHSQLWGTACDGLEHLLTACLTNMSPFQITLDWSHPPLICSCTPTHYLCHN